MRPPASAPAPAAAASCLLLLYFALEKVLALTREPRNQNKCGACKPPIIVRVVGISCFAMSMVGVNEQGEAVTPVYTYADGRNQA
jgi:sugar (pentulose or hexulose) kinase